MQDAIEEIQEDVAEIKTDVAGMKVVQAENARRLDRIEGIVWKLLLAAAVGAGGGSALSKLLVQ